MSYQKSEKRSQGLGGSRVLWVVAEPYSMYFACSWPWVNPKNQDLTHSPQTHTYPEYHTITKVLGQPTLNSADA